MLRLGGSLCLLFGRPTVVQMSSPSSHYVYITFIFNGIERAGDRHPIEGRCRACSFFFGGVTCLCHSLAMGEEIT